MTFIRSVMVTPQTLSHTAVSQAGRQALSPATCNHRTPAAMSFVFRTFPVLILLLAYFSAFSYLCFTAVFSSFLLCSLPYLRIFFEHFLLAVVITSFMTFSPFLSIYPSSFLQMYQTIELLTQRRINGSTKQSLPLQANNCSSTQRIFFLHGITVFTTLITEPASSSYPKPH